MGRTADFIAMPFAGEHQGASAVAVLAAALAAAAWALAASGLWRIHEPLSYTGDGLSHAFVVKTIIDAGWYPVTNPFVGAPFGSNLLDYPFSDSLNFAEIKLLAIASRDWIVVSKLFFFLTFALSGASAYWVLRRLGITAVWAVMGATLFALAPYHFARRSHLLLASYPTVPLGVWLAYEAWRGKPWHNVSRRSLWGRALATVAVGCGGAYYAFFSAFLVVVAGIGRAVSERALRGVAPAAVTLAVLSGVVLANVSPSLVYRAVNGPNTEVAQRIRAESELYGLKIVELLLPPADHRSQVMRAVSAAYRSSAPLVNENALAALGIAASMGLVALLFVALTSPRETTSPVLRFLSVMCLALILLGTIGGLGTLFAYSVTPIIRAYNRVSIFIAFLSLAGLAFMLQWVCGRYRLNAWVAAIIAAAIVAAGAWDQTPTPSASLADRLGNDRQFVQNLERILPKEASVLQLPYQPFPESGGSWPLPDYEFLRGYLYSTTLRWSYGAMKGRPEDAWQRALVDHPVKETLDLASKSGFAAVYVDRGARGAQELEETIRSALGPAIVQSQDGKLVAYRMQSTGSAPLPLQALLGPVDAPIRFDRQLLPQIVSGTSGISQWEPWGRWTVGRSAQVRFARDLPPRFRLHVEVANAMPSMIGKEIAVRVGGAEQSLRITASVMAGDLAFTTREGARTVDIDIPEPRSPAELGWSADGRKLGIGLREIRVVQD